MTVKILLPSEKELEERLIGILVQEFGARVGEDWEEADLVILSRERAEDGNWRLCREIKQKTPALVAVVEKNAVSPPPPVEEVDDFLPPQPEEIKVRVANLLRVAAVRRQIPKGIPDDAAPFFSSSGLVTPLRVDLPRGLGKEALDRLLSLLKESLGTAVILLLPRHFPEFHPENEWEYVDSPYCRTLLTITGDRGFSLCRYAHWLSGIRAVGERRSIYLPCPGGLLLGAAPVFLEFFGARYPVGVLVAGLGEAPLGATLKEVSQRFKFSYLQLRQAAGLARHKASRPDELAGRNILEAVRDYLQQEISRAYLRAYSLVGRRVEDAASALDTGDSAMGKLATTLFHEIRNPLTSIKGVLQLLYEKRDDQDPERRYLEVVLGELDRTVRIIRNFLYFARPRDYHPVPTDLNVLLKDIVLMVELQAKAAHVEVSYDSHPGTPVILADPDLIKQAVLNLAQNALQAMPQGGKLFFRLYPEGDEWVVIEVEDTGVGIPPEHFPRLGEAFFTTRRGGTGLGLAVSYQIAKMHGGRIEVESEEGKGSKFRIKVPRKVPKEEDC
ncbi:ATP-binding protein [Ammonifex thiophilus]|uniref:histidine kinase n=1 Tax=Ammonifex thiophilus TaxID=444093 RepID=A0A3D8P257_9THEO|nr:ATP-binding protein [Ammonifex thiophilus]RDV82133.1 hypothetical protein DXX99_08285 [Ammonifex thiophilus]